MDFKNVYYFDFEYDRLIHGVVWYDCMLLSDKDDTDIYFTDPKGNIREACIMESYSQNSDEIKIYQDYFRTKKETYKLKKLF
jgi:hypothetical protein